MRSVIQCTLHTVFLMCNTRYSSNPLKPSGHYMYRTVVTICTASLTFSSSTFCPHSVFMCFVWVWEQTAIISLYSINWLVCITERECVYCAVRTGSSNKIHVAASFKGNGTRTQNITCSAQNWNFVLSLTVSIFSSCHFQKLSRKAVAMLNQKLCA